MATLAKSSEEIRKTSSVSNIRDQYEKGLRGQPPLERRQRASSLSGLPSFRTKELDIVVYLKKLEGLTEANLNDPMDTDARTWARNQVLNGNAKITWNSAYIKIDTCMKGMAERMRFTGTQINISMFDLSNDKEKYTLNTHMKKKKKSRTAFG